MSPRSEGTGHGDGPTTRSARKAAARRAIPGTLGDTLRSGETLIIGASELPALTRALKRQTPDKPPPQAAPAPASTRSGSKRAPAKPSTVRSRTYPPKVRDKALTTVRKAGIAEAHRRHGIPKPTLTRWSKAAGIDVGAAARARTANATVAVQQRAAEVKLSTVQLLEEHLAQAGHYLTVVAGVNALAATRIAALPPDQLEQVVGLTGPYAVILDREASDLALKALALSSLPLDVRDAEGIVTRAIHDLALLKGEATERGDVRVTFNVPRPDPRASDAAAIPEANLTIAGTIVR